MENYKAKLQEYTQKLGLDLPVYESESEGLKHMPTFKSYVIVDGVKYESSSGHKRKREAEQFAAQAAVEDLTNNSTKPHKLNEVLGKKLLSELLVRLDWPPPKYSFTMEGASHCPVFTSTVEINGATYVGGQGNSKKEAETKVAFVAFQAINREVDGRCPDLQLPAESKETCDLKQPIVECKHVKPELETITNSYTRKKQFLVGTTSCEAKKALETQHEDDKAVGMGYRNSNVNNVNLACVTLMHKQLGGESVPMQQCLLNKESEDVMQHQEYGFEDTEENKQVVQEGRSTDKRNRSELDMDNKKREGKMKRRKSTSRSRRSSGN